MDELLRNISHAFQDAGIASGLDRGDVLGNRMVEDVWREIVSVSDRQATDEEVTLEDFLTRAGSERDDDFTSSSVRPSEFALDSMFQRKFRDLRFQNDNGGVEAGCAGKRKHVDGETDRVLQQKQIRMIKNRESAARSRERKQAYTVELEALVTQLEEENSKLMREEAEQSKKRFNELMKNSIPVIQKRKPLRRVNSLSW